MNFEYCDNHPGAPLTYFNDGGGGVRRIFWGLRFWPKGIFLGRENNTGIFWVLYSSSAQINNNISAIYSFVFDQNESWSWHVLAFQKIKNKICWCKNTEGFFWVTNSEVEIFLGINYEPLSDPAPVIEICEWGPWGKWPPSSEKIWKRVWISEARCERGVAFLVR